MNTYRTFVLDASNLDKPSVAVTFIQAEKYGEAWTTARGILSGDVKDKHLFTDVGCTKRFKVEGDMTVAKIVRPVKKAPKFTRTQLAEAMSGPGTAEEKLARITALTSVAA